MDAAVKCEFEMLRRLSAPFLAPMVNGHVLLFLRFLFDHPRSVVTLFRPTTAIDRYVATPPILSQSSISWRFFVGIAPVMTPMRLCLIM